MAEQHTSPTWQPPSQDEEPSGTLDAAERNELPASAFAFPAQRKEPLTSASHVRSALSRLTKDGPCLRALAAVRRSSASRLWQRHVPGELAH